MKIIDLENRYQNLEQQYSQLVVFQDKQSKIGRDVPLVSDQAEHLKLENENLIVKMCNLQKTNREIKNMENSLKSENENLNDQIISSKIKSEQLENNILEIKKNLKTANIGNLKLTDEILMFKNEINMLGNRVTQANNNSEFFKAKYEGFQEELNQKNNELKEMIELVKKMEQKYLEAILKTGGK